MGIEIIEESSPTISLFRLGFIVKISLVSRRRRGTCKKEKLTVWGDQWCGQVFVSCPLPSTVWLVRKTTLRSVPPLPVPLVVKRAALALDPPILRVGDVSILLLSKWKQRKTPLTIISSLFNTFWRFLMDTKAVLRYFDFINRFKKASRFVNERAVFQRALSKRNFRVWSMEKKKIN